MTRNAALLREIADIIEAKPQRYCQAAWESFDDPVTGESVLPSDFSYLPASEAIGIAETVVDPNGACGSTFCIAGWAVALSATPEEHKRALDMCIRNNRVLIHMHDITLSEVVAQRLGLSTTMISSVARELLGLEDHELFLFDSTWHPAGHDGDGDGGNDPSLVAGALRALADGASIHDVTWDEGYGYDDDDEVDEDYWDQVEQAHQDA